MTVMKVAVLGNPVLRRTAVPLKKSELLRESTQRFIDDMIETMRDYDGVGLAAPQVSDSRRIVVMEVAGNPRYPDALSVPLTVLINPVITVTGDTKESNWEGCLSVPDMRGLVTRPNQIRVEAMDRKGGALSFEAKGFFATVVQHEADHLDGVVYIDRMDDMSTLSFCREYQRYWLQADDQDSTED